MAVYISCENSDTSFANTSSRKSGGTDFHIIVLETSEFLANKSAAILASLGQWEKIYRNKITR